MNYLKLLLALLVGGIAIARILASNSIDRPDGELVRREPEQKLLDHARPITVGDFQLQPQARYDIEARVLSVERYRADGGAALSPIDFAVGWAIMSDSATLKHFKIKQSARFFTIYPDDGAIDLDLALRSSANMHLIPADDGVRNTLFGARPGTVVTLRGYLVNASRYDGFTWRSSLSREDTGAGACELMYVESVSSR